MPSGKKGNISTSGNQPYTKDSPTVLPQFCGRTELCLVISVIQDIIFNSLARLFDTAKSLKKEKYIFMKSRD